MNFAQGLGLVALMVWNNMLASKGSPWVLLTMLLTLMYVGSIMRRRSYSHPTDYLA